MALNSAFLGGSAAHNVKLVMPISQPVRVFIKRFLAPCACAPPFFPQRKPPTFFLLIRKVNDALSAPGRVALIIRDSNNDNNIVKGLVKGPSLRKASRKACFQPLIIMCGSGVARRSSADRADTYSMCGSHLPRPGWHLAVGARTTRLVRGGGPGGGSFVGAWMCM